MCQNVAESGTNMCQNMCLKKPSRITTERAFSISQSTIPQNPRIGTPPRRQTPTLPYTKAAARRTMKALSASPPPVPRLCRSLSVHNLRKRFGKRSRKKCIPDAFKHCIRRIYKREASRSCSHAWECQRFYPIFLCGDCCGL